MFTKEETTVLRGIMDYTVRFPDGSQMRIAPVQHLLVERDGESMALPAYDATNQEIIAAAVMIRNDVAALGLE